MRVKEISKKIRSKTGKAIFAHNMIDQGDHIAVGLSGGKDSAVLLTVLKAIQRWSPMKYKLSACSVDMTGGKWDTSAMSRLCDEMEIPYSVYAHPIEEIINIRDERSPCSFCANMRRGILNNEAKRIGANKVALGHNLDDVVETALMNLFRTGHFKAFQPTLWQSRAEIWVIRPLVYVPEQAIIDEVNRLELPLMKYTCPFSLETERSRTKDIVRDLQIKFPEIKKNILNGLLKLDEKNKWERTD